MSRDDRRACFGIALIRPLLRQESPSPAGRDKECGPGGGSAMPCQVGRHGHVGERQHRAGHVVARRHRGMGVGGGRHRGLAGAGRRHRGAAGCRRGATSMALCRRVVASRAGRAVGRGAASQITPVSRYPNLSPPVAADATASRPAAGRDRLPTRCNCANRNPATLLRRPRLSGRLHAPQAKPFVQNRSATLARRSHHPISYRSVQ